MHVQCVSCLILPRRIPSTDFNKNPCKSFRKCGPAGQPSRFMRADEQYGKAKSPFSQLRQSVQNFYVLAAKCVCLWISMGGGGGRYSSTHSNLEPDTDVGQLHAHATLHSQSQLPVYNGYIDRCVVVGGGAQSLDAANKNLSCLCRATNPDSSAAQPYPSHKSKWAVPILFFSNTVLVILRSAAQTNNPSKWGLTWSGTNYNRKSSANPAMSG